MRQKKTKGFSFFLSMALLGLVLSGQGCIPPSLNGEWKDYSKRWHVCFPEFQPGQSVDVSHKFLFRTVFDTGTALKVRGDFDALDAGDQLPIQITWKFAHFRKGTKLFEDTFPTNLDQDGKFPSFGVTLTSPIVFEKNDLVKFTYSGIDVPHDTDVRLNIKF